MWPFWSAPYEAIIQSKRASRDAALATAGNFVAAEHEQYLCATGTFSFLYLLKCSSSATHLSATEVVKRIEAGRWTATEVLEAYIARAADAHAQTNCLTEGARKDF